ncbi:MAG: response regulator [Chthoniobacter sp.]|nr:response regulator [Chthoniobacter sp.]
MNRLSAAASFIRIPRLVAGCVRSLRAKRPAGIKKSKRKRRVLLVDDESALTMICKLMLEQTDSFVVQVENFGERALATARKFRPDVIFLDIHLPDKGGHAIAEDFQSHADLRDVPIVFWSGSVPRKTVVTNAHGCWPALAKPFSKADLTQLASDPSF